MNRSISPRQRVDRIRFHLEQLKPMASPLNRGIIREIEDLMKHLEQDWLKEDAPHG